MSWQPSDLAPNQIRLWNYEVHTLVEGFTEWSYQTYEYGNTWHHRNIFLYYKGHIVTGLKRQKHALVERDRPSVKYATLAQVVQTYQRYTSLIRYIEESNQYAGLESAWCLERGTPLTQLTLTLTQQEADSLTQLAEAHNMTLEQFAVQTLRAVLSQRQPGETREQEAQP